MVRTPGRSGEVFFMKFVKNNQNVLVSDLQGLSLDLTLDCGQAFRWEKRDDGLWHGVAFGRALTVGLEGDTLCYYNTTPEDFECVWRDYFDLDRDYEALHACLCADDTLRVALAHCGGIRLLRQEPWEMLCSFILSQNTNIPRLKGMIRRLCEAFGDDLGGGDYTFPSPALLAEKTLEDLTPVRAGFRAKYLLDAAKKVACGEVCPTMSASLPLDAAREELMKIHGVGPKVADCTLLYGCGHFRAFPRDVWVNRLMSEYYPDGLPPCTQGIEGFAQLVLFHWRRQQ